MKRNAKYRVKGQECIIKYISRNLDKQLKHLLGEKKKQNPKDKDKISYAWITDNVEVRLKK